MCLSFMGAFIFWSYTAVLISIATIPSYDVPAKDFDQLEHMNHFNIFVPYGGFINTMMLKWSKSKKKDHFIKLFNYDDAKKFDDIIQKEILGTYSNKKAIIMSKDDFLVAIARSKQM